MRKRVRQSKQGYNRQRNNVGMQRMLQANNEAINDDEIGGVL
jgi:hypothetical protein